MIYLVKMLLNFFLAFCFCVQRLHKEKIAVCTVRK